ncbi:MAG: glutamate mutase L [Marmoricola sp.]
MILCADFGSTFTKVALVDAASGELLGSVSHRTTSDTDVLDGLDACRAELARRHPAAADAEVLACSSAGGGLRIAVVGNEELVTAEAGRRVALSSGGRVVAVLSRTSADQDFAELGAASSPDVVLLTGGTDGGDEDGILQGARRLVAGGWHGPVVVAGNSSALAAVQEVLADRPCVVTGNVVPRIGVLDPDPARRAIREMFLAHVIGGKHLSKRADFAAMVQGATPDLVLTGVEVLAQELGGEGVVVVDIGGATTDVHSVVRLDPEDAGLSREVVASTPVTRTVEGDLGMRWSALGTWEAGHEAGLLGPDLRVAAVRRTADPSLLPSTPTELAEDDQIAGAAAMLAVRRHVGRSRVVVGPDGRIVERSGKDLREVALLVGSGGVLRHRSPEAATAVLEVVVGVSPQGWQQPEHPRVVVDRDYVLAAIGLLWARHPAAAQVLARNLSACLEPRAS